MCNLQMILSQAGYVLLQLGDVKGASRCFLSAEGLVEDSPLHKHLIHRNRGLLRFAQKDYAGAQADFRLALEHNAVDLVSVNNIALCLMYQRDLMGATRYLEETLQSDPAKYMDETLVLNLCSMYDLAWVSGTESKRKLSSWISKIAPDDFDLNCTRL
uniref:Uncharacterized protein n=1 Tax=Pyramimonas obovata TaxID=1411642 RepID=A0A7S0N806_9CHLO|mmetsp:Transcript_21282/g.46678  ORF Transcript_21282/g.46678 Transcript_21282/m.46678 type:complete len:158 (+) Transcript_21282:118-591(+)